MECGNSLNTGTLIYIYVLLSPAAYIISGSSRIMSTMNATKSRSDPKR